MNIDDHAADVLAAFNELMLQCEESAVPAEQQPSVLLLLVRPTQNPNSAARILGDDGLLAKLLLQMLDDPAAAHFRRELVKQLINLR